MYKKLNLVMLVSLLVLQLSGCSKSDSTPEKEAIRPVRTVTVVLQNAVNTREFSGVVKSNRRVDLAFRVGGTLSELPAREGDHVKQNQVLARLDQTDFEIQLKAMQADFDRSKGDFDRAKTLYERNILSRSDYQKLESQFYIAEAQLEKAQQDLAYATILAPFEGYITKRHVENFSEIAPRSPVLTLMDLNSLLITIEVPESVMIQAQREGMRPEMYATFDGHESSQFPLEIREVAAQPNTGTQTYPVTLALPPIRTFNVLPGMSAVVQVRPFEKNDDSTDVAYLPTQAVLADSQGHYVFVAVPSQDGYAVIERRPVEVGDISAFGIQITGGLSGGEEVVTAGMSKLTPEMHVLLMDKN
ncbi:efflux RND transporter periplasmic adaptor subunit [Porticoccaceae bacterium LTM1]|nr:efflux RND transporter periplasmic adaptor subunit [Porticoccaceae bacterium LTM1]